MTRALLTYRDYEALPSDGRRYEIHEVTPTPAPKHQIISLDLVLALGRHVPSIAPGQLLYAPVDVILANTTIVQPDIVYLAPDRLHLISRRGIEGPPTLAVEILSPSTRMIDRITKHRLYERYRVPNLWLMDPDARVIEAFTPWTDQYVLTVRAGGTDPVDLPPFTGLRLIPDMLWPDR